MEAVKKTEEFHKKACEYLEMDFSHFNNQVNELMKKDQTSFRTKMGEITKNIENINVDVKEIDRETCLKAFKFCTRHDRDFGMEVRMSAQVLQGPMLQRQVNLKTVMHSDKLLKDYGFDRRQLNMEVKRLEL
jgi:hypothetical protein